MLNKSSFVLLLLLAIIFVGGFANSDEISQKSRPGNTASILSPEILSKLDLQRRKGRDQARRKLENEHRVAGMAILLTFLAVMAGLLYLMKKFEIPLNVDTYKAMQTAKKRSQIIQKLQEMERQRLNPLPEPLKDAISESKSSGANNVEAESNNRRDIERKSGDLDNLFQNKVVVYSAGAIVALFIGERLFRLLRR